MMYSELVQTFNQLQAANERLRQEAVVLRAQANAILTAGWGEDAGQDAPETAAYRADQPIRVSRRSRSRRLAARFHAK